MTTSPSSAEVVVGNFTILVARSAIMDTTVRKRNTAVLTGSDDMSGCRFCVASAAAVTTPVIPNAVATIAALGEGEPPGLEMRS